MTASRPLMHKVAAVLAILYGLTSIVFGILASSKSLISLIAGGGAGLLLVLSGVLIYRKPIWGFVGAAIVSIALLGRFIPGLVREEARQKMSELGLVSAITLSAGGVLVLVVCALALGNRSGPGGCCGK